MSQKQAWLIDMIKQERALVRQFLDLAKQTENRDYEEIAEREQQQLKILIKRLGRP